MFYLKLACLGLLISGCIKYPREWDRSPSPDCPEHVKHAHRVTKEYIDLIRSEGFSVFQSQRSVGYDVRTIEVSFCKECGYLDRAQARQLIVEKVEKFLRIIYQDKGIRPFLHKYPFNAMDISIYISFSHDVDRFEL